MPGPEDYVIRGNFTDHRYHFTRRGRMVARISKKFFSWGDTYRIEILPGENDVVILATAVILDMMNHPNQDHHCNVVAH